MSNRFQKPPGVLLLNHALEPQFIDSTAKFLLSHIPSQTATNRTPDALQLPPTLLAFAKDLRHLSFQPNSSVATNPRFRTRVIPSNHTLFQLHGWAFSSENKTSYFLIHVQAIPKPYRPPLSFTELTRREHDIYHLHMEGYRDREIAEVLGIRLNTAKHHLKAIRRKIAPKTQVTIHAFPTPP